MGDSSHTSHTADHTSLVHSKYCKNCILLKNMFSNMTHCICILICITMFALWGVQYMRLHCRN